MFDRIGRFSARFRWPIIIGWLAVTALITLTAPRLEDVASSNTTDFLPKNAPYVAATQHLNAVFPGRSTTNTAVILLETTSASIREGASWAYLLSLTEWLNSDEAPDGITEVLSPGMDIPLVGDNLVAPDEQLAMISVQFASGPLDAETKVLLEDVQAYLDDHPQPGLNLYLTGNAPIFNGYANSALESVDRTLIVTIALVVVMLLLVYRSPVSPLLPLLTVAIAYLITRGIVAWLGANYMTVTTYANVMLIVVLFGAGTDYCLFLISRFREEMADHPDAAATTRTVGRVGETITSSAGTVIVGFVAMSFAEMGLFNTTGPSLAIGVVVMLLAGLTLTPALLSALGERAFWPGKASHRGDSRLYERISSFVSAHPVQTIVVLMLILAPLAAYSTGQKSTYNMLADLPAGNAAQQGFRALENHMGAGQIQPLTVIVDDLERETALATIDRWTHDMLALDGVADVRSLSSPLGMGNPALANITSVAKQLTLAADLLAEFTAGDSGLRAETMTQENLQLAISLLPFLGEYLDTIQAMSPELDNNADLAAIRQTIAGLPLAALSGNVDASLVTLQTHIASLAETFGGIENAYYLPESLPPALVEALGEALGGTDPLAMLTGRYVTTGRDAALFEVVLADNPYGDEAAQVVRDLRALAPDGSDAVTGVTVVTTDLRDTMDRDMLRAFSLVLLGIFVVLLVLLRALVSPIYLILTILLSYGATLGITRLFSMAVFGVDALTWWVPFFIFTMLIALGMDYNIFLMGRVKEETAQHGMREGVHRAVAATGPIITSAGIIMAGTFVAMMAGTVTGLKQLGFAVAVGVLLDTFVIRTALVPAIAVLLDRWNWWPGKTPQAAAEPHRPRQAVAAPAPEAGQTQEVV